MRNGNPFERIVPLACVCVKRFRGGNEGSQYTNQVGRLAPWHFDGVGIPAGGARGGLTRGEKIEKDERGGCAHWVGVCGRWILNSSATGLNHFKPDALLLLFHFSLPDDDF